MNYAAYNRIYIAGAHSRASTFGHYYTYLNEDAQIVAYLVDNEEENPTSINGIPVLKIEENTELITEVPVFLGVRGTNFSHLSESLSAHGMEIIIPVDVGLDLEIRNEYLTKYYSSVGREYIKLERMSISSGNHSFPRSKKVYVAGSANDKPLSEDYRIKDYEKVIQVGTELTIKRLDTDCFDNRGDNISDRNAQFCELTGLYWIWKNAKEDIVGLVHYRRHFILPENWLERMQKNCVDVILPVPLYVFPSIEENYKERHVAEIWEFAMEYLKENCPEDYIQASQFFKETSLYSPCNMFIMKREILNELCAWLFPILFAVAERGGFLEDNYQNRYPGFISERLITYFFEKNREKYKVVYSDKNFLQ